MNGDEPNHYELLRRYVETELDVLHELGGEFAREYPKIAGRLQLSEHGSKDPHVERVIQAFAFLTARLRRKIDEDFPEITEALLNLLYPHYLRPVPSLSIVQFEADKTQGQLTSGHTIEKHSNLVADPMRDLADGSRLARPVKCEFRTCYPVELWPIEVKEARFEMPRGRLATPDAATALRLRLECTAGTNFAVQEFESLRFYLAGRPQVVHELYDLLFNHALRIWVTPVEGTAEIELSAKHLLPVGFAPEEGLLPYPARSFLGYRLLQEYFAFPEKFHFVDLSGLAALRRPELGKAVDLWILLERGPRFELPIGAGNFRLGCTPIANLFPKTAEPIRWNHRDVDYRINPDARHPDAYEVYSVADVESEKHGRHFEPFYAFRHATPAEGSDLFWHATRRPSQREGDKGTEVYLSLVDPDFSPADADVETLLVKTLCTNRDRPAQLPFLEGREFDPSKDDDAKREGKGRLRLGGQAPVSRIRLLKQPQHAIRAHEERWWRLISHLNLNYISLADEDGESLREILSVYNFASDTQARENNERQIAGVQSVRTRRAVRRAPWMQATSFCRGLEVAVGLDEDAFAESSLVLFASVLEVFLGLYTNVNSFTELVVESRQAKKVIKRWPPRAGELVLV